MREEILEGKLEYPGSTIFELYPDQELDIKAFWKAIWVNYLNNSDTNGVHWYDRLSAELYNRLVRSLSHHGWVVSHSLTGRRWVSVELVEDKLLEFVTPDELQEVKAKYKYDKYLLGCEESRASKLVKQNGETKRTGLVRKGFRDAGNTQFGYDMEALGRYEEAVKLNLVKSMDKIRKDYPEMRTDSASYDAVATGIFDWHKENEYEVFTTGNSISDSRGRAISDCLKRVFNPIGNKDARCALVITYEDE